MLGAVPGVNPCFFSFTVGVFLLAGQKYQNDKNAIKHCHLQVQPNIKQRSSFNCTYIYQTKNLPFQVYPLGGFSQMIF